MRKGFTRPDGAAQPGLWDPMSHPCDRTGNWKYPKCQTPQYGQDLTNARRQTATCRHFPNVNPYVTREFTDLLAYLALSQNAQSQGRRAIWVVTASCFAVVPADITEKWTTILQPN
jgi:hypothetical protein